MKPFFHGPMPKLAAAVLLSVVLLGFARLSFDGKSHQEWENAIWYSLREDPELTQVFPRVDASEVTFHGVVGDASLFQRIEDITLEAFPLATNLDLSQVRLAMDAPWLEVRIDEEGVTLLGRVNNRGMREDLMAQAAKGISGSQRVQAKIEFNPDVRTELWVEELSALLPGMMRLIQEGGVEVRGQQWVLSGQTSSRKDFQVLAQTWEALVPPGAMLDITGLRVQQPVVTLPQMGIRAVSGHVADPNRRERELWEAYEQSRRLRTPFQTQRDEAVTSRQELVSTR